MKRKSRLMETTLLWAAFSIPVLYLAAVAAYAYTPGMNLLELTASFTAAVKYPLRIGWTPHTLRFLLFAAALYALVVLYYVTTQAKRRPGIEHGSAAWGSAAHLNGKYKGKTDNAILTQHIGMGLDGYKHRRNLNQLIVGGSGSGKTRFFVKPNIMEAHAGDSAPSYFVSDPKGEIARAVIPHLLQCGYEVKVFDLTDPTRSDGYNPFEYLRSDMDVLKIIANLIKSTTPPNSHNSDPFWEKAEIALDSALMLYLYHEAPEDEQNFETMLTMMEYGGAKEDDDDYKSPLDLLFDALEEIAPEHIALKQYKIFKQAAGKTAKSIIVSAAVRLAAFTLSEITAITSRDSIELGQLGDRKQAVFCIIPDSDTSLNYIVAMIFTQAFQELYYHADKYHKGKLPHHVRFLLDEYPNLHLPDIQPFLATCRGRNISLTLILQNISQLKGLAKDTWENIVGNCDTFLYLGGNEQSTHKYISELLGKETIETRTSGITRGSHGNSSLNFQQAGRELLTPDEVRELDNANALVFIRGEKPTMDKKYDILRHPNLKATEDGGAHPYTHNPYSPFVLDDLPYEITDPGEIELIEMEETE